MAFTSYRYSIESLLLHKCVLPHTFYIAAPYYLSATSLHLFATFGCKLTLKHTCTTTHIHTHTVIISWNNTNRCMYCCEQTVCASAANRVGGGMLAKCLLPRASYFLSSPVLSCPLLSSSYILFFNFFFSSSSPCVYSFLRGEPHPPPSFS